MITSGVTSKSEKSSWFTDLVEAVNTDREKDFDSIGFLDDIPGSFTPSPFAGNTKFLSEGVDR